MNSINNKKPYEIGKFFEKQAIKYLKKEGFKEISWVSAKKPNSHYDLTAEKNNKFFYIEVRFTKSKKFQITEKKLNALKKLANVLFLFISPKKSRLIPLEKIEREKDILINKGFINNLKIKTRNIKMDKKSLLIQFINNPKIKIIDFLLDNKPLDFSKTEISRWTGLSKMSIHKYWRELEADEIIQLNRKFGKTKLYTLNSKNPVVKKLLELETILIGKALDKHQPIKIPV